jgi:Tfp pilus assembly protein PilO
MTLGSSQKWYLGAVVAATLVMLAGWFLLVAPQKSSAQEITASVEAKQSANASTEREIAALKAQFKDLPALQKQAAEIRSRMPQTPNLPSLLRTLSANAKAAGVSLVTWSPQEPVALTGTAGQRAAAGTSILATPGQVNQIPITLNVVGRFANLRLFLNSIEQMNRSMLVTSLDIKRSEGASTAPGNALTVSINGRVFIANPGMPTAASTDTSTTGTGTANNAEPAS